MFLFHLAYIFCALQGRICKLKCLIRPRAVSYNKSYDNNNNDKNNSAIQNVTWGLL